MSDEQKTAAAEKGKGNALRIVLISVLVVAIAALVIDRRARSACSAAFELVEGMIPPEGGEDDGEAPPTQRAVREALDRLPDNVYQLSGGRIVEEYVWTGTAHKYSLYTYIMQGIGDDVVVKATMNQVSEDYDLESATLLEDKSIGASAPPSQPLAPSNNDAATSEPPAEIESDDSETDADADGGGDSTAGEESTDAAGVDDEASTESGETTSDEEAAAVE